MKFAGGILAASIESLAFYEKEKNKAETPPPLRLE